MTLIYIVVPLLIVALVLWAINKFEFMKNDVGTLINVVVLVACVFWVLAKFIHGIPSIPLK